MGLDMYLTADKYVSGYEFSQDEERRTYAGLLDDINAAAWADPTTPTATVSITVAYWRKANQIHRWFVENVQGGTDDCGTYDVGREQLEELRGLCKHVLAASQTEAGKIHTGTTYAGGTVTENYVEGQIVTNPEMAKEFLPTQEGFFFGGYDYDEYYLDDLKDTVAQIDRALTVPAGWCFQYRASW